MNIASFCFAAFAGTNQALRNLSRTVRLSQHFSVTSTKRGSAEMEFFADHLAELAPKLLILGAWTPAYERVIRNLPPETAVGVYWTSSPGQVDMSEEVAQFAQVLHHPRVRCLFFSSRLLAEAFRQKDSYFELPSIFPMPPRQYEAKTHRVPRLSLFCSPNEYHRKNILNSLMAVARQKREYILYLNGLSENASYRALLAEFKIRYQDFGWLNRDAYERVLRRVDIGLQASFSESFGYVVTDHLLREIPVIASKMVPAMENMPARVRERLILENTDDPLEFGAKLQFLLEHPTERQSLANAARGQMLKNNEANIQKARTALQRALAAQE